MTALSLTAILPIPQADLPVRTESPAHPADLPAGIRLVETTTAGAIDILKILSAFAHGSNGIIVTRAGRAARDQVQRVQILRDLLHLIGCSFERLMIVDGAPQGQTVRAFARRVRAMGPWSLSAETVLAAEPAELPWHGVSAHAPAATSTALRRLAADLLASGKVEGVLAWTQGAAEIRPFVARTPEQAQRLFAGGRGYPNLAAMLGQLTESHVAVVVRPEELACIEMLAAEGLAAPDTLFLIGQSVAAGSCDVLLPAAGAGMAGPLSGDELAMLEQWSLAERAAFWGAQFSNCVQCDGCRNACPFRCYTGCLGDSLAPHNGYTPSTNQIACAHLACATRLAGRCVGCESCSNACPQSVPLYLLHQKANQVLAAMK